MKRPIRSQHQFRPDRLKLWLDRKLVATFTRLNPDAYDLSVGLPLKIGFGPNDCFRGSLRALRIHDYALSGREISQLSR